MHAKANKFWELIKLLTLRLNEGIEIGSNFVVVVVVVCLFVCF